MKASDVIQILDEAKVNEGWPFFDSTDNITEAKEFRRRVDLVKNVPGFAPYCEIFLQSAIYSTTRDQFLLRREEWDLFRGTTTTLIGLLRGVYVYASGISSDEPSSIYVKIDPQGSTEYFCEILTNIDKALTLVLLHEDIKGSVKISGCDRGSIWIELLVGGPIAVSTVGALAWAAAVVHKKAKDNALHEDYVRTMIGLKQESLIDLIDTQKRMLDMLIDTEAKAIYSNTSSGKNDHEQVARIRTSIKMLADEISRGTEICPSIKAGEDVKNLFPDYKKLDSITSKTPLLTDGDDGKR